MAYSDVEVTLEIGQRSWPKTVPTSNGFTHDWEVFVRGVDQADISHFVDKVVFYLHETFDNPKQVIKTPPFVVKESGWAGFDLKIDIYFKNKEEPKKHQCIYALLLPGHLLNTHKKEKITFPNPSGELRKKLIKGGGIGVNGGELIAADKSDGSSSKSSISQPSKSAMPSLNKGKVPGEVTKKHKVKEPKLEDFRASDPFQDLFGTPITKTSKVSPDPKKQSPSSSKSTLTSKPGKPPDKPSTLLEKASAEKSKHTTPKDSKRDKDTGNKDEKKERRDKSKEQEKKNSKTISPVPKIEKEESKRLEEPSRNDVDDKNEKKKKDKKNRDEKSKKDKHKEIEKPPEKVLEKVKEERRSPKPSSSRETEKAEKTKDRDKYKDGEKDRSKHKHKKKEKEKSKKSKEEGKDRDHSSKKDKTESRDRFRNGLDDSSSTVKPPEPHSPSPPLCHISNKPPLVEKTEVFAPPTKEKTRNPLSKLFAEAEQESSDSNMSQNSPDEDLLEFPPSKSKKESKPSKKSARERDIPDKTVRSRKMSPDPIERQRDFKKEVEVNSFSRRKRRSSREDGELEVPVKLSRHEDMEVDVSAERSSASGELSEQYVTELRELQAKILSLDDDEELQRLVSVVTETGQYEITKKTFDFDLCALDRTTVRRLQDFFRHL